MGKLVLRPIQYNQSLSNHELFTGLCTEDVDQSVGMGIGALDPSIKY